MVPAESDEWFQFRSSSKTILDFTAAGMIVSRQHGCATSTASLTTATTTVSAIRDVSTASGRPSRRDQLTNNPNQPHQQQPNSTAPGPYPTGTRAGPPGSIRTAASHAPNSRSYAGSPTGQHPGPPGQHGGNVPQSISTSAFTVGTSRYNAR
jgi:hypothetical protein